MNQPLPSMLPCPFCGQTESDGFEFETDQGTKWGRVVCNGCACWGPEVRTNYDTRPNAAWWINAIEEWNKRSRP